MVHQRLFNDFLDKLGRVEVHVLGAPRSAFQICGIVGLALAIALVTLFVSHNDLSIWVMAAIILAAVATFLGLAMLTKIITGKEELVYYHHEIAVLGVTFFLLWVLQQPILAYLDATILGVGIFLACGRVGCLMVGCCHGRPHRWGVCYRHEHAAAGFPLSLVGVRLFPIQALESGWVFITVLVGSVMILRGAMPGVALAWYSITYNLGRFFFEFMRGDIDRPYYRGFSEAQWISLILAALVMLGELSGVFPFQIWHLAVILLLGGTMIYVAIRRSADNSAKFHLLRPDHMLDVARAIHSETGSNIKTEGKDLIPGKVLVSTTSLGIQISHGKIETLGRQITHYTLSRQSGIISLDAVQILARLILQLRHPAASSEIISGEQGVYHLVVRSP